MSTAAEERARVVEVAKSFLHTPYHSNAMVKGLQGGVDCATLVIMVYAEAGIIESFVPEAYSEQWFLHQGEEKYLKYVIPRARETDRLDPGNLILYKVGRLFAHGAIIVDWPMVIHAHKQSKMVRYAEGDQADLAERDRLIFTCWDD